MKANIAIQVKQSVFPAGTIGDSWLWALVKTDGLNGPAILEVNEWTTKEPFTSAEVDPESVYKISGVRVDPDKNNLGQIVSVSFTTEAEPAEVMIDTAASITVEVV